MEKVFYIDNAATTKVFEEEFDLIKKINSDYFYNPSASYMPARKSKKILEEAREDIFNLLSADNGNLYFTSSATEANNTVFEGIHLRAGQVVLISASEHPSVYESAYRLSKKGIIVKEIPITKSGQVNKEELIKLLDSEVALVSVIHVSNETGAVNDIKELCSIVKKFNSKIIFHSDGVQAFGKIKVNLNLLGVDLYTISAHKIYAPRGIAALFVKNGVTVDSLIVGGGQEKGFRSSTENVSGAAAFAFAAKKVCKELEDNYNKVNKLKLELINHLKESKICDNFDCNLLSEGSPYILSLSFDGIKGEVLMNALEAFNIFVSTGSACSSKKAGNRVLESMGIKDSRVVGSIRISFSPYCEYDIEYISNSIENCVLRFLKNVKK